MTPNKLTGISGIFGLLSIYYVYKFNYISGSLLYSISYIFDCFDGNFARKYNMVTNFGDWFDHIKDNTVVLLLIKVIYDKKDISNNIKIITFIIFIILGILLIIYIDAQEKYYHSKNKILIKSKALEKISFFINNFNHILPEQKLKYLKYFGCGSFNLYIIIVLFSFEIFKNPLV